MFKKKNKKKECALKIKINAKIADLTENRKKGLEQLEIYKKKERELFNNILKINGALITLAELLKETEEKKV